MTQLPTGWEKVPIETLYIGLYDGPHATPPEAEEGPVFLGIKNLTDDGHLDLNDVRHISWDDYPEWTRRVEPQPDDIVFTYEATLHRYAIIPEGFKGCLGRRVALIRPDDTKVDTKFLFYSFFGHQWRTEVSKYLLVGSTVDRIPLSDFPNFKLFLPPLPTQRRIAAILSAYDDLIEVNQRRIDALEAAAQALYREWFVEFRFPGHESAEWVTSELGEIPRGWEVSQVDDVVETVGGGTPRTKQEEYWVDGDINWYTPSDLTAAGTMFIDESSRKINQLGLENSSAKMFPAYSVMMTSRATIGVVSINTTPACANQGFITCIPNERLSKFFIYYWILQNLELIDRLSSGATYKEMRKSTFRELYILVPDEEIHRKFVDLVEPLGSQILNLQRRNAVLRETRDLLLPRLISGEVSVEGLPLPEEVEA